FINDLQNMGSTEEVLMTIFNYFKTSVKYDYDELQVVKFLNNDSKKLQNLFDYVYQNRNEDSIMLKELIIKLLDEAFMELEGRPLTEKNKIEWFRNYGKVVHHEAQPARERGLFKIPAREAYDEIIHIDAKDYPPVYENGLLKEGVCSAYVVWIKQICDALGIPCLMVHGIGTTSHVWNLIYIKEKNTWVNFDMTMVRFYLDEWSKEYGEADKWIFASNEEMFAMQPNRVVDQIIADNGEVIFDTKVTAENQNELTSFLENLQPGETPQK
ncbi:MAG: transglutaminase domain-containing protein, partial [Bacilli bacterium]|nr:transglutaminase domain-containing protein [Bacilli bacterium]